MPSFRARPVVWGAAVTTAALAFGFSPQASGQGPERFALSMFHFNVQYVAGGLWGWPTGEDEGQPDFLVDEAQTEDLIVRESFLPILELLEDHPGWALTLELQAYMVEVMIARHQDVLDLLRELVHGGQVELVSFHYSDQLFLAYPRLAMERSHELMGRVWAEADLEPSEVIFAQEGQFGVGMAPFALAHGRSIIAMPKNLLRYQHQAYYETAPPLFDLDGVAVVLAGRGLSTPEVELTWSFFDDAELLATGGANPYVGWAFQHDPAATDEYVAELEGLEAAGFRIATIRDFVEWARGAGMEVAPLPPVLDGTWQPGSTDSMRKWMGGAGLVDAVVFECERDNLVLTTNVRAHHRILAAETVVASAEGRGLVEAGAYRDELLGCWRDALLGQVTDSSGINPFIREVRYGLDHGAAATECADGVLAEVGSFLGDRYLVVDTDTSSVTPVESPPSDGLTETDPFFTEAEGFSVEAPERDVDVTWHRAERQGLTRLRIVYSAPDRDARRIEVTFPMRLDAFVTTPGLIEDRVDVVPFGELDLEGGQIYLPTANGLVGLGPDLWVVKQTDRVHVAAHFETEEDVVRFSDWTLPSDDGGEWVFWIFEGSEAEALELATSLNVRPTVVVRIGEDAPAGCGCRAAGGGAGAASAGLLVLTLAMAAALSRRRVDRG